MLKTEQTFDENVKRFYVDEEITSFLSSKEFTKEIYEEMKNTDGKAVVFPLVLPTSDKEFSFDLMMIIKHEKATEQGLWELFLATNFVMQKTNLQKLFSYIEVTTKCDITMLLKGIQHELKGYREQFNLQGKTFVEIDADNKIIAFGYLEN